jgi:hypothetical protein
LLHEVHIYRYDKKARLISYEHVNNPDSRDRRSETIRIKRNGAGNPSTLHYKSDKFNALYTFNWQ